jgi:hypothetical protein
MEKISVHETIRKAEQNYTNGSTTLGKYVSWSMHDTIETIDAYLNSKHVSGPVDSLGRDKPFFNIVSAATNIWYRATDLDRKDIRYVPTKSSSVVLAFVANVLLQNWMTKSRFGVFLNQWGRALARYGSVVLKFVEKDGELVASVIPWNRFIADPVQFDALPRIEKFYLTPAQLRRMPEYNQNMVESLINGLGSRETIDGQQKDNMSEFVELYEVHGELPVALLEDDPQAADEDKWITYRQQMHVVSFIEGKDGQFDDYTLFKGKEAQDPYLITHLIEEDGRTLGIGAVEYLFDAQWMVNHTAKNMKDTLDLSSKLIMQTADANFVGRNVLNAIETGDILVHAPDKPLTRLANDKPDITALQNFGTMWQQLAAEITSTPDAIKGNTLPSGTPYSLGAYLGAQANSLFEIMTESKGLAVEEMVRRFVNPHLKKKLKNKDEIVGILDDAGIQEIDSMYVPKAAIKRFNSRIFDQMEAMLDNPDAPYPTPFDPMQESSALKQDMGSLGNKRFFVPDELGEKQWDEIFSDFEWDSVWVEVTNEQSDKQAVLQTLSAVLQTVASNPMILQDPNAKMVFSAILNETGRLSPIQLSTAASTPSPMPATSDGGAAALTSLTAPTNGGTTT